MQDYFSTQDFQFTLVPFVRVYSLFSLESAIWNLSPTTLLPSVKLSIIKDTFSSGLFKQFPKTKYIPVSRKLQSSEDSPQRPLRRKL